MNDDSRWMNYAVEVATQSDDPRTQNGAVLLTWSDRWITDTNRMPENIQASEERWGREKKTVYVEHAERNVVFWAAKKGIALEDSTMYVVFSPCVECARAVISSGVKRVVCHARVNGLVPEHWRESLQLARELLEEAGVKLEYIIPEEPAGVTIRFNGELLEL